MIIKKTELFEKWYNSLKDKKAKNRIISRIFRIEQDDYFGDCEPVGNKIFELRVHYGSGYRIYFHQQDKEIILLLCGGNKGSQKKDIEKAKSMI